MKKTTTILLLVFASCICFSQIDANSVMGIPVAMTIAEMNGITTANEGSLLYNEEDKKLYLFNGTNWVSTSNDNWLIDGNIGLPDSSFLGHRDDVKMEIRSNNLPLLQFGRRATLGLTQAQPDYTDDNQPLVNINGDGVTSALQFTAAAASFYKPLFFTTTDGNFRLKGSAAGTDFFEIGSAGTSNDGSVEFIIGDDGLEPFIFKRFDFRDQTAKELMRIQGSANALNATPRVGINTGALATSTLEINGSIAKSIDRTTGALTLTEDHYSIIIENAGHSITLPAANGLKGREYIIKNPNAAAVTISSYRDATDNNETTIPAENILTLQSDGVYWNQMNNICNCTSGSGSGSGTGSGAGLSSSGTPTNEFSPVLNDNGGGTFFQLGFNGPSTASSTSYEILLDNVPYQLTNFSLGDHTVTENDNGDGTYDYLFTSTSPIPPFNQYRQIQANKSAIGTGLACGCVSFYTIP